MFKGLHKAFVKKNPSGYEVCCITNPPVDAAKVQQEVQWTLCRAVFVCFV